MKNKIPKYIIFIITHHENGGKMKKISNMTLSILLVLGLSTSSFANGLSLNSLGTRALGMGGAFVALSNDATAIYWNPAALAGQKSNLVAYFTGVMPIGTYETTGINAESQNTIFPTGGLLVAYQMDKITLALGVYVPSGLGIVWDLADFGVPSSLGLELESRVGAVNLSPAIGYQVTDKFSVGLAINVVYGLFNLRQHADGSPFGLGLYQFEEESDGFGFGATLGLKYKFNEKLEAGASFRLATEVAMSGTAKNPLFANLPTIPPGVSPDLPNGLAPFSGESDFDRDVTWPIWIGGGLVYRPTKCLTLALDVQYSQWSELDMLVASYDDATWQNFLSAQGEDEFKLDWEDAVMIRLGGELMVTPEATLRLGYYYDPAPAPDETLNVLFPSSTNHVGTIGFGYAFGKYRVDGALEYLFGADREVKDSGHNQPGTHHLDVFAFSVGLAMEL